MAEDRIAPSKALLDVEAFIYEFRSFYEIIGKFITALFSRIGRPVKEAEMLGLAASPSPPCGQPAR